MFKYPFSDQFGFNDLFDAIKTGRNVMTAEHCGTLLRGHSVFSVAYVHLHLQESVDPETSEGGGLRRTRTIKKKKRVSCCFSR